MKQLLIIYALVGVLLGSCGEPLSDHEKEMKRIEREIKSAKKEIKRLERKLPRKNAEQLQPTPLPNYKIIKDVTSHPHQSSPKKRSVDVRLEMRIPKDALESLGQAIRLQSPHKERLFINYYLPDQTVGSRSWASTHFTPKLRINIHGMTEKQSNDPFPPIPKGA